MNTNKKPKSTLLVVCTILFLSIFIILPPVFRVMIPKEEKKDNTNNDSVILICDKEIEEEGYSINSRIMYNGTKPQKNTITYTKLITDNKEGQNDLQQNTEIIPNSNIQSTIPNISETDIKEVASELAFFKTINEIEITEGDNSTSVLINSSHAEKNSDLKKYLQPIKKQQDYYENEGYMCSKMQL